MNGNPQKVHGLAGVTLGAYVFLFYPLLGSGSVCGQHRPSHIDIDWWHSDRFSLCLEACPRWNGLVLPTLDIFVDTYRLHFPACIPLVFSAGYIRLVSQRVLPQAPLF